MKVEMSPAARAAKNAYQRQWSAKNPEKKKEQQVRYWEKKAREMEESAK